MKLEELKDRRIIQILTAYAAISWIILQIVDQVVDRSIFPEVVYKVTLVLIIALSPGIIIIAWFHGAKGAQRIPTIEKWLLSIVAIISFVSCIVVLRINLQQPGELSLKDLPTYKDPRRIAVLYFEPRGSNEEVDVISNGITEALIDELSKIPELFVVSENGSELYRNSEMKLKDIGRSLEVGFIVNGSINVSDDKVRFRLALAESSTGKQLESSKLEYSSFQIFDLIDEITNEVSNFLRRKIGEEISQIEISRQTSNTNAWKVVQDASLLDKNSNIQITNGNNEDAIIDLLAADSLYKIAEQLDNKWSLPNVKRGWLAYKQARISGMDRAKNEHWLSIGLKHADRALQKDTGNADALELKATLLYYGYLLNLSEDTESTIEQAEYLFNESIKANPKQASALTSLSHLYLNKGWISEAKSAASTAYSIDPYLTETDRTIWRLIGISYDLGDAQETKRWCLEGLRRFPDDFRFYQAMIQLYSMPGMDPNIDDAWANYNKCIELCPEYEKDFWTKRSLQQMGMVLAKANLPDSARIVSLLGRASVEEDPTRDIAFIESITRLWIDDFDEAIRLMGLFFSANPGVAEGYKDAYMNKDLFWYQNKLYGQSRFESLIGIR